MQASTAALTILAAACVTSGISIPIAGNVGIMADDIGKCHDGGNFSGNVNLPYTIKAQRAPGNCTQCAACKAQYAEEQREYLQNRPPAIVANSTAIVPRGQSGKEYPEEYNPDFDPSLHPDLDRALAIRSEIHKAFDSAFYKKEVHWACSGIFSNDQTHLDFIMPCVTDGKHWGPPWKKGKRAWSQLKKEEKAAVKPIVSEVVGQVIRLGGQTTNFLCRQRRLCSSYEMQGGLYKLVCIPQKSSGSLQVTATEGVKKELQEQMGIMFQHWRISMVCKVNIEWQPWVTHCDGLQLQSKDLDIPPWRKPPSFLDPGSGAWNVFGAPGIHADTDF